MNGMTFSLKADKSLMVQRVRIGRIPSLLVVSREKKPT